MARHTGPTGAPDDKLQPPVQDSKVSAVEPEPVPVKAPSVAAAAVAPTHTTGPAPGRADTGPVVPNYSQEISSTPFLIFSDENSQNLAVTTQQPFDAADDNIDMLLEDLGIGLGGDDGTINTRLARRDIDNLFSSDSPLGGDPRPVGAGTRDGLGLGGMSFCAALGSCDLSAIKEVTTQLVVAQFVPTHSLTHCSEKTI